MLPQIQDSDSVATCKDSLIEKERFIFPIKIGKNTSIKVLRMCPAFADSATLIHCRDSVLKFKVLEEISVQKKYIQILKFLLAQPDLYATDGTFIKSPFTPQYAFRLLTSKQKREVTTLLYSANQQSFMVVKDDSVQTMISLQNPRMLENWLKMAVKSPSLKSKRKEK